MPTLRIRSTWLFLSLCAGCASQPPFGDACTPGASRCSANAFERCTDDGNSWAIVDACAPAGKICVTGRGCMTCVPNTRACGGDGFDIVLCRGDGSGLDPVARCEPDQGLVCGAGSCQDACSVAEADRSYEGCEYWAVDLDNAVIADQGAAAAQQYAVVVTNPLEVPATVTVEVNDAEPGQPLQIRQVAEVHLARVVGGGDLAIIDLPDRGVDGASDPRLNDGPGTWLSSRAYHIRSTAPIVAYQFNPLDNVDVFSNDASLLLPPQSLDGDYDVLSWPQTIALTTDGATNEGLNLRTFLTIVGTHVGTTVTVNLSTATVPGGPIPAGAPGDTLTFHIGPYDVVNLETGSFLADFTGSQVHADQPVVVFAGSEASDVPTFTNVAERQCCADHLEEQLFPTSSFGTQFVAVKSPLRTKYVMEAGFKVDVNKDEPEYWRVLAVKDGTDVTTTLLPPYDRFTLAAGEFVTFPSTGDFVVDSNRPIAFGQYPASQDTTGIRFIAGKRVPGGDPSSILVPPVEQWRSKYVFLVPNKYAFDFLLVAMPETSSLRFDGDDLSVALPRCEYAAAGKLQAGGAPMPTDYVAIRCPLSNPRVDDLENPANQNDGRHVLESNDGQTFGLILWGWDSYVSYGYPGGTNTHQINAER
jgi:hypothetical protein